MVRCLCFVEQVKDPFVASREMEAEQKEEEEEGEDGGNLIVLFHPMLAKQTAAVLNICCAQAQECIQFLCSARLHGNVKLQGCA